MDKLWGWVRHCKALSSIPRLCSAQGSSHRQYRISDDAFTCPYNTHRPFPPFPSFPCIGLKNLPPSSHTPKDRQTLTRHACA